MSFVTFSSRTRSRPANGFGIYMRHNKNTATEDTMLYGIAIIDALAHLGPAFRPFEISQMQTLGPSMSKAKVQLVRKYMRKIETPTTSVSIEKQLSHLGLASTRVFKDNCTKIGDKEGNVYANLSLSAIPDDLANPILPPGLQEFVGETTDTKKVLDDSAPAISSKSVPPLSENMSSSMSRRRSSCNMPTLLRVLPLNCVPHYTMHDFDGFKIPFPVHPCSTPITPLDQIIHTPRDPPVMHPDDRRGSRSPIFGTSSGSKSPQVWSPSMSPSVRVAGRMRRAMTQSSDRRRLSVVAPPEAPPMHAARRLSYSKAFGKHNGSSPLSSRKNSSTLGEGLACCPENELLASPLAIRTSAFASQRAILDTCGAEGIFSKDFSFTFAASPQAAKV